ncbi:hypothetical protein ANO11243_007570 [Dothideomycetidae sp. 11243]|nr:hypothetical protein ANO11243_007570 [fungal sp. No.11243]
MMQPDDKYTSGQGIAERSRAGLRGVALGRTVAVGEGEGERGRERIGRARTAVSWLTAPDGSAHVAAAWRMAGHGDANVVQQFRAPDRPPLL